MKKYVVKLQDGDYLTISAHKYAYSDFGGCYEFFTISDHGLKSVILVAAKHIVYIEEER